MNLWIDYRQRKPTKEDADESGHITGLWINPLAIGTIRWDYIPSATLFWCRTADLLAAAPPPQELPVVQVTKEQIHKAYRRMADAENELFNATLGLIDVMIDQKLAGQGGKL